MQMRPNAAQRSSNVQLDTLVYPIDNRLYINLTDRCSLACTFCPKHNGSHQVHEHDLTLSERPDVEHIINLIGDPTRYDEIVFCGFGEPTTRLKALVYIANAIKAQGGKTRLNTDGLGSLFNKHDIVPLLATCIDAISISLNAQNEHLYQVHCQPSLPHSYPSLLAFIEQAGHWMDDVTVTAIDGLEGVDIAACERIATERGAKFRARQLDVVG